MLVKMDTGTPHLARVWNYWLGGKDYLPVDREAGDQLREACPAVVSAARDIRDFVGRVVTWLAAEEGIRQFLDIGGGLPMAGETHQVAQRVGPGSKVVYVESGRVAPAQVRDLLTSGPDGATSYVEGNFRAPAQILKAAAATLDLSRPVAFMLLGMAGALGNDQEMSYVIRQLMAAAVPGSCLVLAEGSAASPSMAAVAEQYAATGARIYYLRDREQLRQLFDGLELVPPGVVPTPDWHPAQPSPAGGARADHDGEEKAYSHCGVGRKPSNS
jgi:S-adenosyl methyltransferase